ncbi:SHOCT domain-containing protein [Candidatus Woesearchaeota archaeon]|nr:SHOCT domain-containing protein [Candidatus Woesearchaeota archaeon]
MNMMGGTGLNGSLWWMMSVVGMLFWIALLVVLILLIIWLYKKIIGQATNSGSALEILKKRFVKGEITKKEFESMKNEIR